MTTAFNDLLAQCPIVAILRGITTEEIPSVCDALSESGVRLLEVPLNSPAPYESIASAARHCAGRQLVGAGTVLTPDEARKVKEAGGEFIVSPNTSPETIRETKRLGMVSIPGFFTATEAFTAIAAGADYLKLFPSVLGPGYVKDLKAVIKTPILAVGGVNAANVKDFLGVCCGVGIGSALYKAGDTPETVAAKAKSFVSLIKG